MSAPLKPWRVQVSGAASTLEYLLKHFTQSPLKFFPAAQPGQAEFESLSFASCSTPDEVRAQAIRELQVLSGILALDGRSTGALLAGAVFEEKPNGGRNVFVTVTGAELKITGGEVSAIVTLTDAEGNQVVREPPTPRAVALAALALVDSNVGKAMRLVVAADFKSWVGLYRLHEVIESDLGGMRALGTRGWGSEADLRRFKHSANSVAVGGDSSRHGKEDTRPPSYPMTMDEAESYIRYILESWLSEKMRAAA